MRCAYRTTTIVVLLATCVGCKSPTTSICDMPQNRHFWQGTEVSWGGEIIDVMAPPHGGGIYFTDYRCGAAIELDPDVISSLYSSSDQLSVHLAVAEFHINGRLSYRDGHVVLRPKSLKQASPWAVDEAFDAYMKKRRFTLIEEGIIRSPAD